MKNYLLIFLILLLGITARAQTPAFGVSTDSNGVLVGRSTNFFHANKAALNAEVTGGGGGGVTNVQALFSGSLLATNNIFDLTPTTNALLVLGADHALTPAPTTLSVTFATVTAALIGNASSATTASGMNLGTAALSGLMPTANLGSGSATSSTFLRGDRTWQTVAPGGVTSITGDTVLFNNSGSLGAVTLTLANAPANTVLMNNSGSPATPTYGNTLPAVNLANATNLLTTSLAHTNVPGQVSTNYAFAAGFQYNFAGLSQNICLTNMSGSSGWSIIDVVTTGTNIAVSWPTNVATLTNGTGITLQGTNYQFVCTNQIGHTWFTFYWLTNTTATPASWTNVGMFMTASYPIGFTAGTITSGDGFFVNGSSGALTTGTFGANSVIGNGTGSSAGPTALTTLPAMGGINLTSLNTASLNGSVVAGAASIADVKASQINPGYDVQVNPLSVPLVDAFNSFQAPILLSTLLTNNGPGNGSQLTSLNASSLSSGTVGTARLGSGSASSSTFLRGDQTWQTVPQGTVTSVGMTGDNVIFNSTVTGSPVTGSGSLVPVLLTQTANLFLAGPVTGAAATPTFRAPVNADFPSSLAPTFSGVNLTLLNASSLSSGTVPTVRLGSGSASSTTYLRGDQSWVSLVSSFTGDSVFANNSSSQGAVSLTLVNAPGNSVWGNGSVGSGAASYLTTLPAMSGVNLTSLNAGNLGSGTVPTARLGTGTANSTTFLRGDQTWAVNPLGTVTSVTFTGDGAVLSSTPSAAVTASGTVTATLANAAANTVLGNGTGSPAVPTYLTTLPAVSGVNVTSLNGSAVASGTVADARLSANVPLLNAPNIFTGGSNTFTGPVNMAGTATNVGVQTLIGGSTNLAGMGVAGNTVLGGPVTNLSQVTDLAGHTNNSAVGYVGNAPGLTNMPMTGLAQLIIPGQVSTNYPFTNGYYYSFLGLSQNICLTNMASLNGLPGPACIDVVTTGTNVTVSWPTNVATLTNNTGITLQGTNYQFVCTNQIGHTFFTFYFAKPTTSTPSSWTNIGMAMNATYPIGSSGGGGGGGSGTVTSVTFTGDGTVLSSTPSSAVTTSGTVTATLANAAAHTFLGNNTGSSAAPIYLTTLDSTMITASGLSTLAGNNIFTGTSNTFAGAVNHAGTTTNVGSTTILGTQTNLSGLGVSGSSVVINAPQTNVQQVVDLAGHTNNSAVGFVGNGGGLTNLNATKLYLGWTNKLAFTENFSTLNNCLVVGSGSTWSLGTNTVIMKGNSANTSGDFLVFTNWNVGVDNWTATFGVRVLSTNAAAGPGTYGFGCGIYGTNFNSKYSFFQSFSVGLDANQGRIFNFGDVTGSSALTLIGGISPWAPANIIAFPTPTLYQVTMRRRHETFYFSISNTVNGTFNSSTYAPDLTTLDRGALPSFGQFSFWSLGGTNTFTNLNFTVDVPTAQPILLLVGDSITCGYYNTNRMFSWPWLVGEQTGYYPILEAAAGARTVDMLQCTNEFNLISPSAMVILGGGNDVANSVTLSTTEANLGLIYSNTICPNKFITTATPWGGPASLGVNLAPLATWVFTNFPQASVIDTFSPLLTNVSTSISDLRWFSDGVHPNALGSAKISDVISDKILNH